MSWLSRLNPFRRREARALTYGDLLRKGFVSGGADGVPPVDRATALGVSAVWCADRVISGDLGTSPLVVYQGDGDDAKPAPASDLVGWLLKNPNPEQTGPAFWPAFQHNANLWGFAAAEIVRDRRGVPVELWVVPSPEWRLDRQAGRLTFEAPAAGGGRARLDPDDVLYLPGPSPDGTTGYKLLDVARLTVATAAEGQRFALNRFRNGLAPSGVIEHAGVLSDGALANMRASWQALYAGSGKAGVPMILEEGSKWSPGQIAHNDQLQLAQLAELYVTEVARFFNVSPTKLHQLGRATWANLETLQKSHVTDCLGPWAALWAAEIGRKLLRTDRTGRTVRHNFDRLLTADTAVRFAAWGSALTTGWMTPNEVRGREDLPPLPGGDVLHRPLNQGPAGGAADPKPNPEPPKPDATAAA